MYSQNSLKCHDDDELVINLTGAAINQMFTFTNFEMVLMVVVKTLISVCMSSTLLLISKILLHEPHSNNDGSSNFGQMTMMLCFSSIFFANSIQCGFAVYKLHADEICKKQFLHFFKHQLMQKIGPPNCVQNKKRRLLNETEGFHGK